MSKYGFRPCQQCGTPIPLAIKRDVQRKRFCSRSCRSAAVAEKNIANGVWPPEVSEMSREKQSKVIAKIWSEKQHPMLGRKQSTQSKQKGSESQKRRFAHNPKLILKRDRHPNWKGGKTHNTYGYVVVLVDGSYMLEHRAIAEKMLGRKLSTKEHVHHKNGNKADNLEENLEVLSGSEHIRKHLLERWKAAREQGANCL